MSYPLTLIVAMSLNRAIGKNGEIPWHLSEDLRNFKKVTTGHTVVMGRKTYESIVRRLGHPLPNRKTVVITHDKEFYVTDECVVVSSNPVETVLKMIEHEQVFIIGGAEIYKLFIPFVERIIVTLVRTQVENADTFFPMIDDWGTVMSMEKYENRIPKFTIINYTRTPHT